MLPTQDSAPPGVTNYVAIPLGTGKDETGLFATEKFTQSEKTDVVVFMHGQRQESVNAYWKKVPFKLREEANRSGKKFVLAAPYLGNPVNPGILKSTPDDFVDALLKAIGIADTPAVLGNLILAAHSGGGGPMLKMAMGLKKYAANLQACWGFDSMYRPNWLAKGEDIEPMWLTFMLQCVQSKHDVQFLFNYSADPDTTRHSVALLRDLKALAGGMPHLTIDISAAPAAELADIRKNNPAITLDHDAMVREFWFKRLKESKALS